MCGWVSLLKFGRQATGGEAFRHGKPGGLFNCDHSQFSVGLHGHLCFPRSFFSKRMVHLNAVGGHTLLRARLRVVCCSANLNSFDSKTAQRPSIAWLVSFACHRTRQNDARQKDGTWADLGTKIEYKNTSKRINRQRRCNKA